MKKWIPGIFVLLFLVGIAAAQTQSRTRSGIGLVFAGNEILSDLYSYYSDYESDDFIEWLSLVSPPPVIMIPIHSGSMKIEPEFGWVRLSQSSKDTASDEETRFSANAFRIGCGLFSMRYYKRVGIYFGGRAGVILASGNYTDENDDESSESVTNWYLGPCVGGEYMISENFSFGGEAQLIYTSIGQPKYKYKGKEVEQGSEESASTFDTRYIFVFRWYM